LKAEGYKPEYKEYKTAGEILRQKKEDGELIAVGTTVARTLESWVTAGMTSPFTCPNLP